MINSICNEINEYCCNEIDGLYFSIVFGSAALSCDFNDIDFKIFVKGVSPLMRAKTADFAQCLNRTYVPQNIFDANNDVPFDRKTLIGEHILISSINLDAFQKNNDKKLMIPAIINPTLEYLKSDEVQMRTVLSALTTPHIFICGDKHKYDYYKKCAFRALLELICIVYNVSGNDLERIVSLAIQSPDKVSYKNYLGYKDSLAIKEYLISGLSEICNDKYT